MFSIEGIINEHQQRISYSMDADKGSLNGDTIIMVAVEDAMNSSELTGPIGQYIERDLNNPIAVLSVIVECFDTIIGYEGDLPEAEPMPEGAR